MIEPTFKPMLAGTPNGPLRFPVVASPKLDGVRALVRGGEVLSRTLKPIPNRFVQAAYGRPEYEGMDGELLVGPHDADVFRRTTSVVMAKDKEVNVAFYVFDNWLDPKPYFSRMAWSRSVHGGPQSRVTFLEWAWIENQQDLDSYESVCLEKGYEGIMVRDPFAPYKWGRSTAREGYLLKIKRFEDSEAEVIGFEQFLSNENEAKVDALGHTERSSHKAGMVPKEALGALVVRDVKTGVTFNVGSGFDWDTRVALWYSRAELPGKFITYKFFPTGGKDKPRFPIFKAFRDPLDMGEPA